MIESVGSGAAGGVVILAMVVMKDVIKYFINKDKVPECPVSRVCPEHSGLSQKVDSVHVKLTEVSTDVKWVKKTLNGKRKEEDND